MAGEDDPLVPLINAKIMHSMIPNSRLQVMEDGHLFLVTQPVESSRIIEDFLRE
jgi:pimeloyl-ACP methyl ester carboxylesterase